MKVLLAVVFYISLVSVWADCGCLRCSKHLKVVSPPNAPVTVVHRGEPCICEKSIPYRLEIPQVVCEPCQRRSYGYKVETLRNPKPRDPVFCKYGIKLEVPRIEKCSCHYLQGLVAKTDRVVMPATDECVPPKPVCGPIFEYYGPERPCRSDYVICNRHKRNLIHKYERGDAHFAKDMFPLKADVDWKRLLEPKFIKPIFVGNPWEKYLKTSTIRDNVLKKSNSKQKIGNSIRKEPLQDKPLRINIPLLPRKQFFLYSKTKPKRKLSPQTIHPKQNESNQAPKTVESKVFERLVQKSGKFADVQNVKITLPQNHWQNISKKKARKTRSIAIENKSFPFYKLSKPPDESYNELPQDFHENLIEKERVELRKMYLKPFDVETILPQNQIFYVLNTPIRMLSHVHKIREHVSPMVQSIPNVFDKSANYIINLSKRFKRSALEFLKEFGGNIKGIPGKMFFNILLPTKRNKRNIDNTHHLETKQDFSLKTRSTKVGIIKENSEEKNNIFDDMKNNNKNKLSKRAIVKLVKDDDVHEFLKEKLSIFTSSEENDKSNSDENILSPVLPEIRPQLKNKNSSPVKNNRNEMLLEKLKPKLSFKNGKPFLDIEGAKKPLTVKRRKHFKPADEDIQEVIDDVIEEARLKASEPIVGHAYESEMPIQTIKNKITQILENIQSLIEQNFEKHEQVHEELLRLQNLKQLVIQEWKHVLIKKKQNDLKTKVNLLNKINEILSMKDDIVEMIGEILSEDRNFNTNNLVKILIRLQKLHCILVKIVENFAEGIRYQTPFDVATEIKQVDFLEKLNLVNEKSMVDISASLRNERDLEVEKRMEILDNLKGLLERDIYESKGDKISKVAKLLWELNNSEKLQRETILEMNDKIQYGLKIRKELKIIFDLEKQMEDCGKKLSDLFDDILKGKARKMSNTKHETTTSKYGKLKLKTKPLLKKISLKKPLSLLKKNKTIH